MKKCILTLLGMCVITSCNSPATVSVTSDNVNVNITSSARMGGRGGVLAKANGLTVAVYDNNDASFKEGNKTARFGLGMWGASKIAGSLADSFTSTENAKTVAGLEGVKATEATKQAQIAADAATRQAEIAAETLPQ
jgi:hypothetical protein